MRAASSAAGVPDGQLANDGIAPLKEDRRAGARDHRLGRGAGIAGGARLLQKVEMALGGADDDGAWNAGGAQAPIDAVEPGGIAERGIVDRLVHRRGRGIADDGAHVVDGDGAGIGGIEAELGDLGAAGHAVGAEHGLQRGARFRRDGEAARARLLVDDAVEIAIGIGVAGDRRGALMGLAQLAQARSLALVAGGDHHPGIDRRRGEKRFDRRLDGARPGKPTVITR